MLGGFKSPVLSYHHISGPAPGAPDPGRRVLSLLNQGGCTAKGWGSAGAGGHRLNCAFSKQSLHARKGQPALQDAPASLDEPTGAGPEAEAASGVLRPRPPAGTDDAFVGPEAFSRASFSSDLPRRPHLSPPQVTRRPQLR